MSEIKKICLDLFSGLGGFSEAFLDKGWIVIRIDNDKKFSKVPNTIIADIMNLPLKPNLEIDILLASPPCECFSVASISTHWTGGIRAYIPKTEGAKKSIELVKRTIEIIREWQPKYWVLENPRGVLRKMEFMQGMPRYTVTYCQYGESRMKPTDIWTNLKWTPKPMCRNNRKGCHELAPRGSKTGTQGLKDSESRAKIPYKLSEALSNAVENANNIKVKHSKLEDFGSD